MASSGNWAFCDADKKVENGRQQKWVERQIQTEYKYEYILV